VLNHVAIVSGCICILQKWDEARQGLIKKLKALGVPLLVLIIVPPDVAIPGAAEILPAAAGRIQILEMGKIEATLARLQ